MSKVWLAATKLFVPLPAKRFSLTGLSIVNITFVMDQRGRWRTGEAYVEFAAPEMVNQAMLKHREEIGNR